MREFQVFRERERQAARDRVPHLDVDAASICTNALDFLDERMRELGLKLRARNDRIEGPGEARTQYETTQILACHRVPPAFIVMARHDGFDKRRNRQRTRAQVEARTETKILKHVVVRSVVDGRGLSVDTGQVRNIAVVPSRDKRE